jgi:hypothetical protein
MMKQESQTGPVNTGKPQQFDAYRNCLESKRSENLKSGPEVGIGLVSGGKVCILRA